MFAELGQFLRHAPATLALKRKLPQAELYAELMRRADEAGLADRRHALVDGLRGHVVEVGCGTGAMFGHYRDVERVTAIEPDAAFAALARDAAARVSVRVDVIEGRGEAIPVADAAADAVVVALVLCSVPRVDDVVRELARVVKPGGVVRLLEHVRSPRLIAGALMHAINPIWLALNGQGCRMNRDPLPALERGGLRIERVEPFQVWSAGIPAFPMRLVDARRA